MRSWKAWFALAYAKFLRAQERISKLNVMEIKKRFHSHM
jgi:hypothetical protein